MKVGIIGNGFVGEAQAFAFSPTYDIKIYDVDPDKSINTLEEVYECEVVFVCVPSPMNKDGSQNLSYIEDVFDKAKPGPVYVIKSTVIPGTTRLLQKKYKELSIVFSPEFLTQRTAKLDMMTQARVIFGGDSISTEALENFYSKRFKNRNYIHTDPTTAEFIKYMNNTFFATKVSFLNEFKLLAEKLNVSWETAIWGFASDGRIGDSHLDVPGPDGKFGFGGTCFPKDINAIIDVANDNGVDMNVLKAAWATNLQVRPEKDWEKLKGKAVV
jgi:nucleotide sugar dehydrogenase